MSHPSAGQLVEAVRLFLKEAEEALDGRQAFHAKVAANALTIVARELEQRPDAAEAHILAPFGGVAALCDGLRSGSIAADDRGVIAAVRTAVLARLAVDNPRYPTFARLQEPTPAEPKP
jgi:hypothetical protein